MKIDWKIVRHSRNNKPIGAIGFIDDKAAVIASFFEDKDWDNDGTVSLKERIFGGMFTMKGKAAAEVASHAYADPEILMRDTQFGQLRGQAITQFASGLVADGVYAAYFSMGIKQAAGTLAGQITQNAVKSFLIKKTLSKAVQESYRHSLGLR